MTKPSNLKWNLIFKPPFAPPESVSKLNFLFTPIIHEGSKDFKERVYEAINEKDQLLQVVLINDVFGGAFADIDAGIVGIISLEGYVLSSVFTRVERSLITGDEQRVKCLKVIDPSESPLYLYGYPDKIITSRDSKYRRR